MMFDPIRKSSFSGQQGKVHPRIRSWKEDEWSKSGQVKVDWAD
jgi:hypothetical protein